MSFPDDDAAPRSPNGGDEFKAIKRGGQKFLRYCESKNSLLVSCKQMMSHLDSATLLLIASHFPSELMPLTFQLRILQDLLLLKGGFIWKKTNEKKGFCGGTASQPKRGEKLMRQNHKQKCLKINI
jgi:hypothetical protein